MEVVGQVIQAAVAVLHNKFPVAHTDAQHVRLVEFPIEEVVLLLFVSFAYQRGIERDSIEVVVFNIRILESVGETRDAGCIAECGHQVVEGELMVGYGAGLDLARPAHNERHANAAFVGAALLSLQKAVAVEEIRVGTAFLVRAVVRGEDDDCVLVEAFLF